MIKVIIVDDERSSCNILKILIEKYFPSLEIVAICTNMNNAEQEIINKQPDLAFLDIKMRGGGGFELLAKLNQINFAVVFVTAHQEYALKALKEQAVDYLIKPINKSDLEEAINKSLELIQLKKFYANNTNIALKNSITVPQDDFLVINKHKGEKLKAEEITYIKAESNYSTVYTRTNSYTLSKTLKEIEESICNDNNKLIRIHKSFIVNYNYVQAILRLNTENFVTLKNGEKIGVSRRRWLLIKEVFKNYLI
jgi:two-component system, LytTR family, response regulator